MNPLTLTELEAGLDAIRGAPKDAGVLQLIVRRPQNGQREVLQAGRLELTDGLVGDNWKTRSHSRTPNPDTQLTVTNSRVIALLAQTQDRWPLAGDQLFIDLDLSKDNVPSGTRLAVGSAVIEVTPPPHTGCKKFMGHFGQEALNFVNSRTGKHLQLRGINAKVIQPGMIRVGDVAKKLAPEGCVTA
ncbi:MAG: MOSC domain-containing protein [Verrucomicrobia bacterium]|nr:MOSC domain-containing protein [Verrucomicrobiota bacterium]